MKALEIIRFVWNHPSNRRRRLRALTRALAWQVYKRTIARHWDMIVFDGLRLRCYPESYGAGLMIYTSGRPDHHEMRFMARYLRPGDAFVDVGANIGIYTLFAARLVGNTGKVLAFEAGRRAFARLQENVQRNSLTHVEPRFCAVADRSGYTTFLQSHDLINRLVVGSENVESGEQVPCTTLDDALAGQRFTMGKIDIEGAETLAFRGAEAGLRAGNPPVWLLELKDPLLSRYGSSARQLADQLAAFDYHLALFDADTGRLDFPSKPWSVHGNILALHRPTLDRAYQRLGREP